MYRYKWSWLTVVELSIIWTSMKYILMLQIGNFTYPYVYYFVLRTNKQNKMVYEFSKSTIYTIFSKVKKKTVTARKSCYFLLYVIKLMRTAKILITRTLHLYHRSYRDKEYQIAVIMPDCCKLFLYHVFSLVKSRFYAKLVVQSHSCPGDTPV